MLNYAVRPDPGKVAHGVLVLARMYHSKLIPHLGISQFTALDPEALHDAGVRGVVVDSDYTLKNPGKDPYPGVVDHLRLFMEVFSGRVGIHSNGQYSNHYRDRESLEEELGVPVIETSSPKPRRNEEVPLRFGLDPREIAVVGDGLVDILYGNRQGMLTVLQDWDPESVEDVRAVDLVKRVISEVEMRIIAAHLRNGYQSPAHPIADELQKRYPFTLDS